MNLHFNSSWVTARFWLESMQLCLVKTSLKLNPSKTSHKHLPV